MQDASAVRTQKLYYKDAYQTSFSARIISADGRDLVLDQTLFFPEEGGQSPDRGILAGCTVLDVQIRDGEIHHILSDPLPAGLTPGTEVSGEIDGPHRFSNMQQHSGEHLFSGIVHRRFGLENIGFHCSDREVTLDYNGSLTAEQLQAVEREVNAAIVKNIPSEVRFLYGEEAKTAVYRSKLDLSGEVRVVTFAGVDACACCAPHVARTGEIGCLKVVGVQKRYLTTSPEEVFGLVTRMREEKAALLTRIRQMETERLLERVGRAEATDGSILFFEASLEQKPAREAVNALASRAGKYAGIFIGNDRKGYRFIIGSLHADAREAANLLKQAFNARGGGQPAMVQGSVKAAEAQIRTLLSTVHT